jgi:hypothetical protein
MLGLSKDIDRHQVRCVIRVSIAASRRCLSPSKDGTYGNQKETHSTTAQAST